MGASGRRILHHLHTTGSLIHHVEDSRTDNRSSKVSCPRGTPDTDHWIVYTQKKTGAPFKWAGSTQRTGHDGGRSRGEHYGQDQKCVNPSGPSPMTARVESSPFNRVMPPPRRSTRPARARDLRADRGGNLALVGTVVRPTPSIPRFSGPPRTCQRQVRPFRAYPRRKSWYPTERVP